MKTRLIHVKVTEEDIRTGIKWDPRYCPIRLAVRRVCPRLRFVVNSQKMLRGSPYDEVDDDPRDVLWPPKVHQFIDRFDAGKEVSPFEFEMEIKV